MPSLFHLLTKQFASGRAARLAYRRLSERSGKASLMSLSTRGSLHCQCEPTDAAKPRNDRRRSCRTCGCAIIETDPGRLYEALSAEEIRGIVRQLQRLAVQAESAHMPATLVDLARLHPGTGQNGGR